jgi:hypothetical protein
MAWRSGLSTELFRLDQTYNTRIRLIVQRLGFKLLRSDLQAYYLPTHGRNKRQAVRVHQTEQTTEQTGQIFWWCVQMNCCRDP